MEGTFTERSFLRNNKTMVILFFHRDASVLLLCTLSRRRRLLPQSRPFTGSWSTYGQAELTLENRQ